MSHMSRLCRLFEAIGEPIETRARVKAIGA
jgi:hypothetical protein